MTFEEWKPPAYTPVTWEQIWDAATRAERERCAAVAEQIGDDDPHDHLYEGSRNIAEAIRSGCEPARPAGPQGGRET